MRYIFVIILMALLVSCANTAETTFKDEPLEGDYRVTGVNADKIPQSDIIFSFDPLSNRVSGITGCNNFSANYNQEGRDLEFSVPMNTRKYCEGKMEMEREILISIEKASRLEFNGNEITIFGSDNKSLITLTKIK